jgi:hypothetical protein
MLMRRLWSERSVTFAGAHEKVTGVGIAPLPVQRPIPIWFGALAPAALRRAGRLADGWFPSMRPGPELTQAAAVVHKAAVAAGRDPSTIGMEGRLELSTDNNEGIADQLAAWREAGATHASISTMGAGFPTVDHHIDALESAAKVVFA